MVTAFFVHFVFCSSEVVKMWAAPGKNALNTFKTSTNHSANPDKTYYTNIGKHGEDTQFH